MSINHIGMKNNDNKNNNIGNNNRNGSITSNTKKLSLHGEQQNQSSIKDTQYNQVTNSLLEMKQKIKQL